MRFNILYVHLLNSKEVKKFPKADLEMIREKIDQKLTNNPDLFGKPLRRSLRGYWSLRVEDYRVIYRIRKSDVLIFIIENRSSVYKTAEKLLG